MLFTPAQLRDTVGLSVETFRHWKRVLPPFTGRNGNSPCFSIGDLLAAAILRRLTDVCGVRVGRLTRVSNKIADLCNTVSWTALENRVLVVEPMNGLGCLVRDPANVKITDIAIFCPLTPIMTELRDTLLSLQPPATQVSLPFPPAIVTSEATVRRQVK